MVLGELGFVEYQSGPAARGIRIGVEAKEGVRRHDDVRPVDECCQIGFSAAQRVRDDSGVEGWCELGHLGFPIGDHAGGSNDQKRRRRWIRLPRSADHCESLQGLTQAHVVGEYAAQTVLAEEIEPTESVDLIRTQRCRQRVRDFDGIDARTAEQSCDLLLPSCCLMFDSSERRQFFPQPGLKFADREFAGRPIE